MFIDTHCHIHEATLEGKGEESTRSKWIKAGKPKPNDIIKRASEAGVEKLICVGTTLADSQLATRFVKDKSDLYCSVGIHPHEAKKHEQEVSKITEIVDMPGVIAIGEVGLDYYYENSPRDIQSKIFKQQLQIAEKHDLPVIFHVRDAFDDFFAVLDDFKGIRGVVHSFTADITTLDKVLARGLYIGLNGILTFTKNQDQLEMAKNVPKDKLLLETDSPFLTPVPHRGKICEPKHLLDTAKFLADLRGESLIGLGQATTANAEKLFQI